MVSLFLVDLFIKGYIVSMVFMVDDVAINKGMTMLEATQVSLYSARLMDAKDHSNLADVYRQIVKGCSMQVIDEILVRYPKRWALAVDAFRKGY